MQNDLRRLRSLAGKVPIKPIQQKGPKSKKSPSSLTTRKVKKGRKNRLSAKNEAHWGVILTYWGTFITLIAFGYTVIDDHIFIATALFITAVLQLLLGMLLWFGATWKRFVKLIFSGLVVGLFIYSFYRPFVDGLTPTFLYLVPTHELVNAEQRAFFVERSGPRMLANVEIALRDNKAGTVHIEKYSEINPGPQNLLSPRYFWFKPSSPWDEDYTVTITSSKNPLSRSI